MESPAYPSALEPVPNEQPVTNVQVARRASLDVSVHNDPTTGVPTVGATRASVSMTSNNSPFGSFWPVAGPHARATSYSPSSTVPIPPAPYFSQFDIPSSYSTPPLGANSSATGPAGIESLEKGLTSELISTSGYSSTPTPQPTTFQPL